MLVYWRTSPSHRDTELCPHSSPVRPFICMAVTLISGSLPVLAAAWRGSDAIPPSAQPEPVSPAGLSRPSLHPVQACILVTALSLDRSGSWTQEVLLAGCYTEHRPFCLQHMPREISSHSHKQGGLSERK